MTKVLRVLTLCVFAAAQLAQAWDTLNSANCPEHYEPEAIHQSANLTVSIRAFTVAGRQAVRVCPGTAVMVKVDWDGPSTALLTTSQGSIGTAWSASCSYASVEGPSAVSLQRDLQLPCDASGIVTLRVTAALDSSSSWSTHTESWQVNPACAASSCINQAQSERVDTHSQPIPAAPQPAAVVSETGVPQPIQQQPRARPHHAEDFGAPTHHTAHHKLMQQFLRERRQDSAQQAPQQQAATQAAPTGAATEQPSARQPASGLGFRRVNSVRAVGVAHAGAPAAQVQRQLANAQEPAAAEPRPILTGRKSSLGAKASAPKPTTTADKATASVTDQSVEQAAEDAELQREQPARQQQRRSQQRPVEPPADWELEGLSAAGGGSWDVYVAVWRFLVSKAFSWVHVPLSVHTEL